ncbi:MAG: type II secretion system protein [Patescibacteria group bacterium]
MKNKKGFTLIELLVVIAVIGLLSSIILASLNSARAKSADGAIKSNLNTIRTQAGLFFDSQQNYGSSVSPATSCYNRPADSMFEDDDSGTVNIDTIIESAIDVAIGFSNPSFSSAQKARCVALDTTGDSQADSWALAVMLRTSTGVTGSGSKFWCIDSTGAAKQINNIVSLTNLFSAAGVCI